MSRRRKVLGIVGSLAAALMLSGLAAVHASATPRLTPVPEQYPVTIKGTQVGVHALTLPGGRRLVCTTTTAQGIIRSRAEAEEGKTTIVPAFAGCTAEILGNIDPVTVTFNSCDYDITDTEITSGTIKTEGWEVTGSLHVKCNTAGDKIEIHVFANATTHAAGTALCTYTIHPQGPLSSIDTKTQEQSEGAGTSFTRRTTIKSLSIQRSSGTTVNCGAAEQAAEYTGDIKFEAFNEKGEMLRSKWDF